MTNREKLTRKVIEAIHGLPYDEAVNKEFGVGCTIEFKTKGCINKAEILFVNYAGNYLVRVFNVTTTIKFNAITNNLGLPITLPRVMQALKQKQNELDNTDHTEAIRGSDEIGETLDGLHYLWKLTKENGEECSINDQTDETINALLKLL